MKGRQESQLSLMVEVSEVSMFDGFKNFFVSIYLSVICIHTTICQIEKNHVSLKIERGKNFWSPGVTSLFFEIASTVMDHFETTLFNNFKNCKKFRRLMILRCQHAPLARNSCLCGRSSKMLDRLECSRRLLFLLHFSW